MNKVYLLALFCLFATEMIYAQQSNQPAIVTEQQLVDMMTGKTSKSQAPPIVALQSQPPNDVDVKFATDVNRDSSNDVVTEKYSHIGDNFASWISQKFHTASLANGAGEKMLAAELGFTQAQTTQFLQVIEKISMGRNKVEKQIEFNRCKRFAEQSKVEGQAIAIENYIYDLRNNIDISEYYQQQLYEFALLYPQLQEDLAYVYESYPVTVTDMTPDDYDWLSNIRADCH